MLEQINHFFNFRAVSFFSIRVMNPRDNNAAHIDNVCGVRLEHAKTEISKVLTPILTISLLPIVLAILNSNC